MENLALGTITPLNLRIREYESLNLPAGQLPDWVGELLWRNLDQNGRKLLISFPSPKTDGQWQLTAQGWVGQIQVPHQLTLTITP